MVKLATGLYFSAAAFLASCAAPLPPASDGAPPDFSVSVTVLAPDSAASGPRSLRPARYILEPDAVLRAAVGPGTSVTTFPPPMRQLTPAQVDELWRLVMEAGYLQSDPLLASGDGETRQPKAAVPTAVLYIAGQGERRTIEQQLESASAVHTRILVDHLAELAWVRP